MSIRGVEALDRSCKEGPMDFEKSFQELQSCIKKLESGEQPLEEALKLFEQGVGLVRKCQDHLKVAEQKVEILMKTPTGEMETQPFDPERGGPPK
jgi:exodeoxyribonuclease VII small subunit